MKQLPIISVVTVSYNAVSTIEQTILSVVNQTYPRIEYIIIDGGSTDGTVEVIKKYADRIAYWVSEPDKGIYDAMNKGGRKAIGDFIQFLNAGDWLENEHIIEKIFKDGVKEADVIYGDMIVRRMDGVYYAKAQDLSRFKNDFPLFHPSTFIAKSVFIKHLFDVSYRISADFKLLRDVYYKQGKFVYFPVSITNFDGIYGLSSSGHSMEMFRERGRILGVDKTLMWKITCINYYIQLNFKSAIKKILKLCAYSSYQRLMEKRIPSYLEKLS
ncbi:glycosyltransferase family 2 protein [Phocaeicola sp.]|uniref:glycosyltransferase family 2 protein n=1 Tax=Phocaeicola sp. TaxID=2773926 RepID=UPI0023CC23B0|nr:glycosyltransferase family 2 protein [Phocaeicola sp.]MDE5677365.1 glycosyltransferase [Phocaeicola sp.]